MTEVTQHCLSPPFQDLTEEADTDTPWVGVGGAESQSGRSAADAADKLPRFTNRLVRILKFYVTEADHGGLQSGSLDNLVGTQTVFLSKSRSATAGRFSKWVAGRVTCVSAYELSEHFSMLLLIFLFIIIIISFFFYPLPPFVSNYEELQRPLFRRV
jgi:hypothetical protein